MIGVLGNQPVIPEDCTASCRAPQGGHGTVTIDRSGTRRPFGENEAIEPVLRCRDEIYGSP
jgi:hypothetical protein